MTAPLGAQACTHPFDRFVTEVRSAFPGVLLTVIVALAAFAVRTMPVIGFLSPMILAVIVGAAMRGSGAVPPSAQAGIRFSLRRILRLAIVLLGLQLTLEQIGAVGVSGIAIIAVTLVATFIFTMAAGRLLKIDRKLSALIAAGTSICGASAIIAANTVTRAPDEDAAYAVACVTVFGSLSMMMYPLLLPLLPFSGEAYGLWAGASIHEIAQVVAAAFQGGSDSGHFGTVAKLSRVMLLAPLVLAMGWFAVRKQESGNGAESRAVPVPWFVFGFVALVSVNSVIAFDPDLKRIIVQVTTFLLTVALAAMGLETDARKLRARGLRPLLLGAVAWIFIAVLSFLLVASLF